MEQKYSAAELSPKAKRCAVYIDGFNAYYGIFKYMPGVKWLNFQTFLEALCSPHEVEAIKYFTAVIAPQDASGLDKNNRQQRYIKALRSLPKLRVILGKFQTKTVFCQKCFQAYSYSQEKKTDVNIALNMTVDAVSRAYDSMVLISGDSDLHPVCQWIKLNRPEIKLCVYIPAMPKEQQYRKADFLREIGVPWSFLPLEALSKHQFPDPLILPFGSISKPVEWF